MKSPFALPARGDFSPNLSHYPTPFHRGGLRIPRGSAFWLVIEIIYHSQQAELRRILTDLLSDYAWTISGTSEPPIKFYTGYNNPVANASLPFIKNPRYLEAGTQNRPSCSALSTSYLKWEPCILYVKIGNLIR